MSIFCNESGKELELGNLYKNACCFLCLGGPSLASAPLDLLQSSGIVTFGVNNSPKVIRPKLWALVDCPQNFLRSIWVDPSILKFVPFGKHERVRDEHRIFDSDRWTATGKYVCDCPAVIYYKTNERFDPASYLQEGSANWGNHSDLCECGYRRSDNKFRTCPNCRKDQKERTNKCEFCKFKQAKIKICPKCGQEKFGSRSVIFAAVKIIFELGFRKLFLLGADFKMQEGAQNYAWEQERSKSSVTNNNDTYKRANERFDRLRPYFEKAGFYVWNCTPNSGLKSFDTMEIETAIKIATKDFPDIKTERASGLYDRRANEKKKRR